MPLINVISGWGKRVDVLDTHDSPHVWRTAVISETGATQCLVHYEDWPSQRDEWIPRGSFRFAPIDKQTRGKYTGDPLLLPKKKHKSAPTKEEQRKEE